jgi:pimeloyl-ACP methyl ester carboxylesterase
MLSQHLALSEGRTLHLKSGGAGLDIVLIHGAMTTHTDWMGVLFEKLAHRARIWAVDRPGHGQSRRARFEAGPRQQADQIREGVRAMGVKRPVLVGHSFGGIVASAWAAAYPEEVSGLVLVAPIAFREVRILEHPVFGPRAFPFVGPMISHLASPTLDAAMLPIIQKIMFAPSDPPADWLARYPYSEVLNPASLVSEGEDSAAILPGSIAGIINYRAISAPVRIIAGERDLVVNPWLHARRLAGLLPRAQLSVRLDAGHMAHHTASDTFFAVIDDLLARLHEAGRQTEPDFA